MWKQTQLDSKLALLKTWFIQDKERGALLHTNDVYNSKCHNHTTVCTILEIQGSNRAAEPGRRYK